MISGATTNTNISDRIHQTKAFNRGLHMSSKELQHAGFPNCDFADDELLREAFKNVFAGFFR